MDAVQKGDSESGDRQVQRRLDDENFFAELKEFKAVALRSDKTDTSFESMIYACAAVINSR